MTNHKCYSCTIIIISSSWYNNMPFFLSNILYGYLHWIFCHVSPIALFFIPDTDRRFLEWHWLDNNEVIDMFLSFAASMTSCNRCWSLASASVNTITLEKFLDSSMAIRENKNCCRRSEYFICIIENDHFRHRTIKLW